MTAKKTTFAGEIIRMEIGKYNLLRVKSQSMIGLYLTDGENDVLLPKKYVKGHPSVDDEIEVFVYLDNENRPIATTLQPFACVGDFVFMTVKDVNAHGAFLDWGIAKDIFVPYSEQREDLQNGKQYLVHIFIDDYSGRITATTKWGQYIEKDSDLEVDDEVQILIAEETDLGFKVIIENKFEGLIFKNEIFGEVKPGDIQRAYIKNIRFDKKIDVSLQPIGYHHVEDFKQIILHHLKMNNGILDLGDKSPAESIYSKLKMSKKNFKRTIGGLYKDRVITVGDLEIRLVTVD